MPRDRSLVAFAEQPLAGPLVDPIRLLDQLLPSAGRQSPQQLDVAE